MRIRTLLSGGLAIILSACAHSSQLTSGSDYIARYDDSPAYASTTFLDDEVRSIAAIEPDLRFPARIGLARIEGRTLTTIPGDESQYWAKLSETLGDRYGELIPVSPLITAMVNHGQAQSAKDIVGHVRKGSARQHLDYVLIYEVDNRSERRSNALRLSDLTVLGLFVMPSRKVEIESTASAILIDVRNGYPYGTATSFADKDGTSTFAGREAKQSKLTDKARVLAVSNLTDEVEMVFEELRDKKYQQLVEAGY